MKNKMFPLAIVLFLCGGMAQAKESYIPVLYNLSTLFDFNPVKGHIKSLHSVVNDDSGKLIYKIDLSLNKNGCVDSLNLNNIGDGYVVLLKRQGNSLTGLKNQSRLAFELDAKCNLISRDENGDVDAYTLEDNGLLKTIEVRGKKIAEHFYDTDSNLVRVEFYASGMIASQNAVEYADVNKRPLDYKIVNTSHYSQGYVATNTCEYTKEQIPTVCKTQIIKSSNPETPSIMLTSRTSTEFY